MSTTTSTSAAPQKSNIRKLAEFIYDTGRGHEIIATLDTLLTVGLADDLRALEPKQEGGRTTC